MIEWFGIAVFIIISITIIIKIYNIFSGRNFVHDSYDKFRLSYRSIEQWEQFWEKNSNQSDIVICLTTIPSRLPQLDATIKSLLYQTRRPARIRLHLPHISKREKTGYDIPNWLQNLKAVEIIRCEDYGPATKLIPALQDQTPDQRLLIVDDDKLYPPDMVYRFHEWAQKHPDEAIGSSGWIVPDDLTDRAVTTLRTWQGVPPARLKATRIKSKIKVDIIQGHSGYLVKPRFFDPICLVDDYTSGPPEAFFVDDVWISGYCEAPKIILPSPRFCFVSYRRNKLYNWTSLEKVYRADGTPERNHNTILIRYLRDRWMSADTTEKIIKINQT